MNRFYWYFNVYTKESESELNFDSGTFFYYNQVKEDLEMNEEDYESKEVMRMRFIGKVHIIKTIFIN